MEIQKIILLLSNDGDVYDSPPIEEFVAESDSIYEVGEKVHRFMSKELMRRFKQSGSQSYLNRAQVRLRLADRLHFLLKKSNQKKKIVKRRTQGFRLRKNLRLGDR